MMVALLLYGYCQGERTRETPDRACRSRHASAGLAQQRLIGPGVVLVATIRRDGTPRLSRVEPYVLDGALWLSMMWQSAKAQDLARAAVRGGLARLVVVIQDARRLGHYVARGENVI
jgi:hypothetical protein